MAQTRSQKSIINSLTTLVFYILNVGITIFARPIFLKYLGPEVQGMQTTMSNIFSMMSIVDLGIGSAVTFMLYKPLYERDTQAINEIVSILSWFYRRISYLILLIGGALMLFFPYIFGVLKPMQAPLWYAYATFGVSMFSTVAGYLVNYRSIIFDTDQRSYRLTINMQGFLIARNIVQMLILIYLPNPFMYFMGVELLMVVVRTIVLERMVRTDYPWFHPKPRIGKSLLQKYPLILEKTKQLFVHKFGSVIYDNVTPLLIFVYVDFVTVSAYQNYMILYSNMGILVNSAFNSIGAGVGSLVAEDNINKIKRFFWEYLTLKNYFSTLVAFAIYHFAQYLIPLWLGKHPEYLLSQTVVVWIAVNIYVVMSRGPLEAFLNAKGMYSDVWAPIAETIINIVVSVVLGYFFGIAGALGGVILSTLIIIYGWKSYFLFRKGFGWSPLDYWRGYIIYPIIAFVSIWASSYVLDWLALDFSTISTFLLHGIPVGVCYIVLITAIYWCFIPSFRTVLSRIPELAMPILRKRFPRIFK